MKWFNYKNKELYAEGVSLRHIGNEFSTPCYIYSEKAIKDNWLAFKNAMGNYSHRLCYAVKANSNISILKILVGLGSGFDIVSGGELERVLEAGGETKTIVFSGVGKRTDEIKRALEVGIYCFNVESEAELERINELALTLGLVANISLRVNPNIDALTHPYISTGLNVNKFGLSLNSIDFLAPKIKQMEGLNLICIGSHIGSQLTQLSPFLETLDCLLPIVDKLRKYGFNLQTINVGGGLGIKYKEEKPPLVKDYVSSLIQKISSFNLEIIFEPGRAIVGDAGIFLTKIEYLKHNNGKHFAIVDGAMNDFMRPSLYDAWHDILPVLKRDTDYSYHYDIVGPVCESADFLGKSRQLQIEQGDLLAITTAGAYGFSMSSNYNSRARPAEVLVSGNTVKLIRKRETLTDLFHNELL